VHDRELRVEAFDLFVEPRTGFNESAFVTSLRDEVAKAEAAAIAAGSQNGTGTQKLALVVQAIQRDHMFNRGYLDIAYAALIGGNGDIYLGRPNNVVQAAVLGKNTSEWSVCFLTDREITAAQETSFEFLLYLAELNFVNVSHVPEPHSEACATDCPGDAIRAWLVSRWG